MTRYYGLIEASSDWNKITSVVKPSANGGGNIGSTT